MTAIKEAASRFLSANTVAITGVSRQPKGHGSNLVFQRFRDRGYEVYAVNPNAERVEGVEAFPTVSAIPGEVDAVVIGTRPEHAMSTMEECARLGISKVWMHQGVGGGSVSPEAAAYGREHGIEVIDGGCPLMYGPTADTGHKCMRVVFGLTGRIPREVT